jgi:signal transduction histidine kinase
MGGFVVGSRLAPLAGTLEQALRPGITVRTEIAPDLWDFNADPEELYFALLNLCRNSADAMLDGGTITVAARNVDPSAGASWGFVEIVVADEGEGMPVPVQVLSQTLPPYFTTKAAGGGIGLGLVQVHRFAEGGLVEDDFAAATAAFLNKLSLDETIEHLVIVSDLGLWGRCASTSTAT